jgi:hypothetical protein
MLSALKTKRARVGLALIVLLAFSGAAVAYFSTTGSGSGSVTVGTSSALTITPTITPPSGGLVPGGAPATVSFSVNNPGGKQYLNTISLGTVTAYTNSSQTTVASGCDTSQFSMSAVSVGQDLSSGTTNLPAADNGSLQFADSGSNQDGCKGVYLVANFNSNEAPAPPGGGTGLRTSPAVGPDLRCGCDVTMNESLPLEGHLAEWGPERSGG